ncbi:TPA: DUF4131 domain-containing protein [Candidatus Nomurabacteria bacterium]|nr:MAG: hypothetical protein O210_OD1C00001G0689 [Parcubacteria bacterium RAAC4_OD1_1]HCY26094.1 DUF4131 domain-containing protein [Candidatus Nomurabacteria bacterium]
MLSKKEIIIIIFLLCIGATRYFFFIPKAPELKNFVSKEVLVEGIVYSYPAESSATLRFNLKQSNENNYFLISTDKGQDIFYGDKLKVKGILKEPDNFMTNTGREFNYKRYLSNKNIYYIVDKSEIDILDKEYKKDLRFWLYKIRKSFSLNILRTISYPENSLSLGLLLGDKSGFDRKMDEDFIKTGTIHIVALSGYNITIIAENVIKIFELIVSKNLSIIFSFFTIVLFVIMTGGEATAIRAGIMASILLLSKILGKNYYAKRILFIAFFLMIAYDPRYIIDMSFQLSFLATFGILYIHPKIFYYLRFITIRFKLRETISTTLSATIAVLPLILYSTGVLSIVSLPANVFILPIIPFAMLFSFITSLFTFISPYIAYPFALISEIILSYVLKIIEIFSSFSFASINVSQFSIIFVFIIYGIIIYLLFKKNKNSPRSDLGE